MGYWPELRFLLACGHEMEVVELEVLWKGLRAT